MAKFYSGIDTSVGIGAETLDGMLANGNTYGISPSKDIDCQGISASGVAHIIGGIKDTSGDMGDSGQVLSSTGTGLNWIDSSEGSTANAVNVGTNLNSTNSNQFIAFMGASSGNNPVRIDTSLTYNPSTKSAVIGGDTPATVGQTQLTLRSNSQVGLSLLCGAIQNATITFGGVADGYSSGASGYDDGKIMYDNSNNHMQFNTAGSERFRIDSGGQIIFQPMTTSERDALSAQAGGVIYNSDDNKLQVYNGSGWVNLH